MPVHTHAPMKWDRLGPVVLMRPLWPLIRNQVAVFGQRKPKHLTLEVLCLEVLLQCIVAEKWVLTSYRVEESHNPAAD